MTKPYLYYTVWKGRQTGVLLSWEDCEKATKRFSNSEFKGFKDFNEAQKAFSMGSKAAYLKSIEQEQTEGPLF